MTISHVVSPSNIQSSLDDLWNAKENKNKMRASLFNLIFFVQKSSREEYIRKVAYNLVEKFPARIFFISLDSNSSEALTTSVAVISTTHGEFDITCDLIEISASEKEKPKIPFILLPHLIPDLPVFLVWTEDPTFNQSLCDELKHLATRIIFDSESTEDLSYFAESVLKIQKESSLEVADLNWARLESWRLLISSAFYNSEKLEKLKKASSMTITYNSQETPFFCHTKIQAIYLQAWIASRLNWKVSSFQDPFFLSFAYLFNDKAIEVHLKDSKNAKLPPGMILSIEIKTSEGGVFTFSTDENLPGQVAFEYATPTECSLKTVLQIVKGESGQSLVKEICHKGTSHHYIEALEMITHRGPLC